MAAGYQLRMRASVADRDRAVRNLQESFIEGRLTPDEFEHRMEQALAARDFPELLALTADLPVRGPFDRLPAHRTAPHLPVRRQRARRLLARLLARLHRSPARLAAHS